MASPESHRHCKYEADELANEEEVRAIVAGRLT